MVEDRALLSGFWSNFKAYFGKEDKDYSITAQPVATHLLVEEVSWYRAIFSGIKGIFVREERPEIEVTAQPVEVQELFQDYKIRSTSFVLSVGVQCLFVTAILFVPLLLIKDAPLTANETELYFMSTTRLIAPRLGPSGGGGGGGLKAPKPPSKGRLPKPSDKQLTPPTPKVRNPRPLLPVEPTVIVPQLAQLPAINLPDYGDPLGIPGPPSPGPGSGGGIGTGTGTGVGPGEGAGVGPGKGGGIGGGVYRVGGGVTPPTVLSRIEPVYSEEARKAKYQGVVVLSAIVRKDGSIEILKVIRSLGTGLGRECHPGSQGVEIPPWDERRKAGRRGLEYRGQFLSALIGSVLPFPQHFSKDKQSNPRSGQHRRRNGSLSDQPGHRGGGLPMGQSHGAGVDGEMSQHGRRQAAAALDHDREQDARQAGRQDQEQMPVKDAEQHRRDQNGPCAGSGSEESIENETAKEQFLANGWNQGHRQQYPGRVRAL